MSDASRPDFIEGTLVFLSLFSLLAWVFWVYSRMRQKLLRDRLEFQTRMLARFESSREIQEFLETEGGRALFTTGPTGSVVLSRILTAIQLGIALTVLGPGMIVLSYPLKVNELVIAGILLTTVGIGFLLSAAASYWFSKRHGLLEPAGGRSSKKVEIEP